MNKHKLSFKVDFLSLYNGLILMNIIKDLNDLPPNIFGFSPESLSLAEENTYLGKAIIELQNIRDNLGLKCILTPSFSTGRISIRKIKKDEFQTLLQKFGSENYTSASFGEPFSHLTIPI
mgnify:FL=1